MSRRLGAGGVSSWRKRAAFRGSRGLLSCFYQRGCRTPVGSRRGRSAAESPPGPYGKSFPSGTGRSSFRGVPRPTRLLPPPPAFTARPGRAFGRSHQSIGGSAPVVATGPRGIWRGAPSGGAARGGSAPVVTGWGRVPSRGAGPAVAGGGGQPWGASSGVTACTVPAPTAGAGAATTGGQLPPAWPFPAQGHFLSW
jgi:hypothetical protein